MENRTELIEKCIKLAEENLEKTIIFNYKLEKFNENLEKLNQDVKVINQDMKSMVGDKE